jgi:uncharacterized protein with HEPN domain
MQRDLAALLDILEAAKLAQEFLADMTAEELARDRRTQSAVIHQLTVLGEAVKRLSPEFRAEHPEIPWAGAAGMRDVMVHEYDAIDLESVRATVRRDLPALVDAIKPLVPPRPD